MKIAHYMPEIKLSLGGTVRAVLDLSSLFAERGHDVTLITCCTDDVPDEWLAGEPNTPTVRVIAPPSLPMSLYTRKARSEIADILKGSDVIHLHETWTPSNVQLGKIARRLNIPYVIMPHGMLDDWCMAQRTLKKKLFLAIAGRALFENAAFVHCTAEAELSQSCAWFPNGRGRVVANLLDLEPFNSLPPTDLARDAYPQLQEDVPSLLFLSRVHVKKGIEHLIRAAATLEEGGTPCNVLIAGSGDTDYVDSLKKLTSELGIDSRVSFLGMVTGDLKLSLFRAADLFVLPTSQENFGFVLVEALAAKTPVLTTMGVDIWPELKECGGALIIDDALGDKLPDAIRAMVANPEKLKSMGEKGCAWVMQNLAIDQIAQKIEAMYVDAAKTAQSS